MEEGEQGSVEEGPVVAVGGTEGSNPSSSGGGGGDGDDMYD